MAINDLRKFNAPRLPDATRTAMDVVTPDANALWADFTNRWGDGKDILEYKERRPRQPEGFKRAQVCATALAPSCRHMYRIRAQDDAAV